MSLNKQIFLYSISTDDFYNSEEQFFHKRLLRLYIAKNKNKSEWRKKWINKLIKKKKRKLTYLLDAKKNSDIVRELNIKSLKEKNIISLFTSPKALGVTEEHILCKTGTLGIPEFGTNFAINMLLEIKPTHFADLVKIAGLSHGTNVWQGNVRDLIVNNVASFNEVVGCRDDIMVSLIN